MLRFDKTDPVRSVFAELLGKPAWQVRQGYGSFLTLEFGEPWLDVHEAIPNAKSPSAKRRRIKVRGEWHLWIYCCDWRILEGGAVLAHSESETSQIQRATNALDSQVLLDVTTDPDTGGSRFLFDQNLTLETTRYDEDTHENWYLFAPDGNVLSYRADGRYHWTPANRAPDEENWLPLPS